jgi:hypothetical protein
MMDTHLAFTIGRKSLINGILIPKYYDPEIQQSVRVAEGYFDLPALREVLLPGDTGSRLGDWIQREFYGTGDIPYVRTSDLYGWRIRSDYKKGVSNEVYEGVASKQDVKPFDILMVAHGTYLVGAVAIVTESEPHLVLQDHVFRLRVSPSSGISPYLLLAALSTSFVKRQVRARQFSADIIDKIGERHLELRVPIPKSAKVRSEIVSRVERILTLQTATRTAIKEASQSDLRMTRERAEARYGFKVRRSQLKKGILIPKYYDPAVESALSESELNSAAPWVTIGSLVEDGLISLETGVEVGKMAYGTGDIPFIRTTDIADWEVKHDFRQGVSEDIYREYEHAASLKSGDILLVRDGTYLVGSSALVGEDDLPALICGGLYRIRVEDTSRLTPFALLAFLNLPVVRRQMRARQFTRDVIDTLGYRILEVRIPSPLTPEAERLAATVADVMVTKAELKRDIWAVVKTLEPPVPALSTGRPGWSMR